MYKGDRRPSIQATLKKTDGSVVDLSGCSVKFQLIELNSNVTVLNETASIQTPASAGIVKYDWKAGETDLNDIHYRIRFEVTFADSTKQTFPKDDNFYVDFHDKEAV